MRLIRYFKFAIPVFSLWLACSTAYAQTTNGINEGWPSDLTEEADARRCFIETERIVRMPKEEQVKQIAHVYHDFFLSYERRPFSNLVISKFPPDRLAITPEQTAVALADGQKGFGAVFGLFEAGRENCLAILRTNINELVPLVQEDLSSSEDAKIKRGIRAVGLFHLSQLFDDLVAVFQKHDALAIYAAQALRDLNDPRAIRILVERFPDRPTEYYESLLHLQKGRKAEPAILKLIGSPNARIREQAAYALRESGDIALVPIVRKLFADGNARVREHAAVIPFNMPKEGFAQLRPDLVRLLDDPDARVRWQVASAFAFRKDDVCAEALLKLLQEPGLEGWMYSNVIQSVNILTGSYFGYKIGEPPMNEANKAAMERFAQWIKERRK